jgi:hypothetical protein
MSRPDHPGRLTLSYTYGDVYVQIAVQPNDPFELTIDIKPKANIDQTLMRTTQRTLGRSTTVTFVMPDRPQLWLGHCAITLDPLHISPAREWCDRYAAWLRDGDLNLTAPRAQQVAA